MVESTVFAQRMKEAREKCGLKQKELAGKVGVTPQTISAYEKTGKVPTLDNAISIARALDVSLDWLCGIEGNTSANGELETLGDIARFLHELTSRLCGRSYESCQSERENESFVNSGPRIIFDDDEIGSFLSDDVKMRTLLNDKTFGPEFYDRWLSDRIQSLDKISVESYLKDKYPF